MISKNLSKPSQAPTESGSSLPARVILFHKQATSARTRFLRFSHGGVCGPEPLPGLAAVLDDHDSGEPAVLHPGALVHQTEKALRLPAGSLEAVGDYRQWVDIAGGPITVFLAGFTTIDPPFAEAEARGAAFIDLTQARGMPPAELELLRRAYELLLGG